MFDVQSKMGLCMWAHSFTPAVALLCMDLYYHVLLHVEPTRPNLEGRWKGREELEGQDDTLSDGCRSLHLMGDYRPCQRLVSGMSACDVAADKIAVEVVRAEQPRTDHC